MKDTAKKPTKTPAKRGDPEWYWEHREELGRKAAEAMRAGRYTIPTPDMTLQVKGSQSVTIRLALSDLELAKTQAAKKGLAYQTYLKSLLHQALIAGVNE